jgi:hypothetical protein
MKRENSRISLTLKEADDIRELLESLSSMCGTLDEDFNAECRQAERLARNLCQVLYGHRHPTWQDGLPTTKTIEMR